MIPKSLGESFRIDRARHAQGALGDGRGYTICDPYLFTLATWLEGDSVDLSTLPKVMDHRKRMSDRPAVRKVLAEHKA